jgi:hypothetical protein
MPCACSDYPIPKDRPQQIKAFWEVHRLCPALNQIIISQDLVASHVDFLLAPYDRDTKKVESLVGVGMSSDTLTALFKNKCSKDPTKYVIQAAKETYQELGKRGQQ